MSMVDACQTILAYACVGMLGALALGCVLVLIWRPFGCLALRIRRTGRFNTLLALVAVVLMVVYGGEKPEPLTILSNLHIVLS